MHVAKLVHMMAERHKTGGASIKGTLIVKAGRAIPTWISPVAKFFFQAERPLCPEQAVWREVAARAVLDALGVTPPLRNNKSELERGAVIREAQSWFRSGDDAPLVFRLAELPFESVRNAVLNIIQERNIA